MTSAHFRRSVRRRARLQHSRPLLVRRTLRLENLEERALLAAEALTVADRQFAGATAFGDSLKPSLSADGQRVVFASDAAHLVPNDDNGVRDAFLYDRGTGRVELLSVTTDGLGSADRGGVDPEISPSGRYVAFISDAADLVASPPVNNFFIGQPDVYVRDLLTDRTVLVSSWFDNSRDSETGVSNISIVDTPDGGALVAWQSSSANMVSGDTNGQSDVFVRKLNSDGALEATQLVSSRVDGTIGDGPSFNASLTPGGRFVVFQSQADNLVPNDNSNLEDIYVRDLVDNTLDLVTVDSDEINQINAHASIAPDHAISDDGRYVVFTSGANNLVPQDTSFQTNAFIRDRVLGTTRLLSMNRDGTRGSDGRNAVITPDGRFAAFVGVSNDTASDVIDTNGTRDVFVSEITPTSIVTRLASVNADGDNGGNAISATGQYDFDFSPGIPEISDDGRFVAFASEATDLVAGLADGNQAHTNNIRRRDVFVRDMQQGVTWAVSTAFARGRTGDDGSYTPVISSDGRFLAFESGATDLVPGDGNTRQDIFLFDALTGVTEVASPRSPLSPARFPVGGDLMAVTPDGRYAVFLSDRGDLLAPDVPGVGGAFVAYLFVADRQTGHVQLASVNPNGGTVGSFGGGQFPSASISDDGRFLAFVSSFNDLDAEVAGTNGGVYVRDLQTGVTTMISRNPQTGAPANDFHGGTKVSISPDGRWVSFSSIATNLIPGVAVPNDQPNLYLFDRKTDELRLVTINFSGLAPATPVTQLFDLNPVFSADSSRMTFVGAAVDLVAGVADANNALDVFAMDLTGPSAFQPRLVSESLTPGVAGDAESGGFGLRHAPSISADGRYVVFGSLADNLTPEATPSQRQVFRRDLVANTTELVSWNAAETGGVDGQGAYNPQVSADGNLVMFQARSANISPLTNGNFDQIYVRDIAAGETRLVSINPAGDAAGDDDSTPLDSNLIDRPRISPNGRFVAFLSQAKNLIDGFVDGTPTGSPSDIFVRDLVADRTVLVTYNYSGTASADRGSGQFFVSDEGTVIFDSIAHDLVPGDRNTPLFSAGTNDVFAFEYHGAGQIRGTLFDDQDGDGEQGMNERGIADWRIYLDANDNGRFDPGEANVTTSPSGEYAFTGLPAGEYTVAMAVDTGYVQTAPANSTEYAVTLATDESVVDERNFGAALAAVDLAVDSVTMPETGELGRTVTIAWHVRNAAANALMGDWQDAVYLSSDATLDASDTLVAVVPHTGGLPALGTYLGQASIGLPPLPPGEYFAIVRADRRRQVAAEANRNNNLSVSLTSIALSVPELELGVPDDDRFAGPNENRYYQVIVAAGKTLVLELDSAAAEGGVELYARLGALPTPHQFDFAARDPQADQLLTIPETQAGVYFVLARSKFGDAANEGFTLSASMPGFGVRSVSPISAANEGGTTIAIRGADLSANTTVSLKLGAATLAASDIDFHDPSLLFATFELTGQAPGLYDVQLNDGQQSATLAAAFEVTEDVLGMGQIFLTAPEFVRIGRTGRVLVEWTNLANINLPAPLLRLTAGGATLRLEDQAQFVGNTLEFLGSSDSGPPDVIRPGQRLHKYVVFQPTEPILEEITFKLEVTGVAGGNQPLAPLAGAEPEGEDVWHVPPPPPDWGDPMEDNTKPRGAFDPNEIIGPAGFGPNGFLGGVQTLPYTIHFENDPEFATAPAQEATITHELDLDLDLATFELGDFGFGSLIVDTPPGLQSYQTRVDYRNQDGSELLVDVRAELDAESGVVVWTFRSVDPVTGELPDGVFDGFLPVNDESGRGEGFVSFSVRPQDDADTGTKVDAAASIVFDVNAPVLTNTHTNTIDQEAPESQVEALPLTTADPDFTVNWSGDDGAGSGVAFYDVYVSIDGGPFQLWQDDTTAETAVYNGEAGHTYGFYSVATDHVGWGEGVPAVADLLISVILRTWHNAGVAEDVDGLGGVNLQDLIAVVTFLRNHGVVDDLPPPNDVFGPPPYVDVDNNDKADLQDLLRVVVFLRAQSGGGGEGEIARDSTDTTPDLWTFPDMEEDEDDAPWNAVLFQIAEDIAKRR